MQRDRSRSRSARAARASSGSQIAVIVPTETEAATAPAPSPPVDIPPGNFSAPQQQQGFSGWVPGGPVEDPLRPRPCLRPVVVPPRPIGPNPVQIANQMIWMHYFALHAPSWPLWGWRPR